MVKILKISFLLTALFILCAPSCSDEQAALDREEEVLNSARNELRKEFESDYLDLAALFAHETAAIQKLTDLSDFVKILTDTSLESSFREKAGEMISNTFKSDEVFISLSPDLQKEISIKFLINSGLQNNLIIPQFHFDSVKVQEPLSRTGNSTYHGKISCCQVFTAEEQAVYVSKTVELFVSKKAKAFGSDTLKVWNTSLGAIK